MKIAIFGGSFNPVHKGHIHLCTSFIDALNLDKVLLIPANIPPHKSNNTLASAQHRYHMCKLATQSMDKIEVSNIELIYDEISYTYKTINRIKNLYGASKIYLIIGSDMFLSIDTWKNTSSIFENTILCTCARKENEYQKLLNYQKQIGAIGIQSIVKNFDVICVSSTQIRNLIASNVEVFNFLQPSVIDYIKTNQLYKNN